MKSLTSFLASMRGSQVPSKVLTEFKMKVFKYLNIGFYHNRLNLRKLTFSNQIDYQLTNILCISN